MSYTSPESDWRGGRSHAESNVSKQVSRWFASLVALALLGVLIWYLLVVFLHRADTTYLVALRAAGSYRLALPPIEYQGETIDRLSELPGFLNTVDLETPASIEDLPRQFAQWVAPATPDPEKTVVVLYVNANSVVLDGDPCLLCAEFSLQQANRRCSLSDLLDEVAAISAKTKLLVLDTGQLAVDPRLGLFLNDFPRHVDLELRRRNDPSLWVLCSNAPSEAAHPDHAAGLTLLGGAFIRGLQGHADLAEEGGNDDQKVGLRELYQFVLKVCHDRATNVAGRQTPLLFHAGRGMVPIDSVDDLPLANVPRDFGAAEEAPVPAEQPAEEDQVAMAGASDALVAQADRDPPQAADAGATEPPEGEPSGDAPPDSAIEADSAASEPSGENTQTGGPETGTAPAPNAALLALERAWQLRDQIDDDVAWSPMLFAPQLWRAMETSLVVWEHRLRSGKAYQQSELRFFAQQAAQRLQELHAAIQGERSAVRSNDSFIGSRLLSAWTRFAQDRQIRDSYEGDLSNPNAAAVRSFQRHLYRATDYVRWHSRASWSAERRLPTYSLIESLLQQLADFNDLLQAIDSSEADVLRDAAAGLEEVAGQLNRQIDRLAEELTAEIDDPFAQQRARALLSSPLLDARQRARLLQGLDGLSLAQSEESGDASRLGPISKAAAAAPSLTVTGQRLERLRDTLRLETRLLALHGASTAVELESAMREVESSSGFSDDMAKRIYHLGDLFSETMATLPRQISAGDDGALDAQEFVALRLLDARDIETELLQSWDAVSGIVPLPPAVAPPASLVVAADPLKVNLDEWFDLNIQVRAIGTQQRDVIATLTFDPNWVELRNKSRRQRIEPASQIRALLRPDRTATFIVQCRAKRERTASTSSAPVTVLVSDGAQLRTERRVELALPAPDQIDLAVRREGLRFEDQRGDKIQFNPFPNRKTTFELALRNRSERPRSVKVELLALRRLSRATWAPGHIVDTAALEAQLFDAGTGRLRNGVVVVARHDSEELSADSEKWEPIEFVEQPPPAAEGDEASVPPPSAEAERFDVSHGLACRITDLSSDRYWLKWIEIIPQLPETYMRATARFERQTDQIVVNVAPQAEFPPGVADAPMNVRGRVEGLDQEQFTVLSPDNPDGTLRLPVPRDDRSRYVEVDVDGWPRAFGFDVVCSRTEDRVGEPARRDRSRIRINQVQLEGDPRIYVTDPRFAAPTDAPPPEGEPPVIAVLGPERLARFPDRRGVLNFVVDFQVDAPSNAFIQRTADDAVFLTRDSDNRQLVFYSDRQQQAWLTKGDAGWLTVESKVSDFKVRMSPEGRKNVKITLETKLTLDGRDAGNDRLRVLLDSEPPEVSRFSTVPAGRANVILGRPIRVNLRFTDPSGIDRLQFAFTNDGRLEAPVEVTGTRIYQDGEQARTDFVVETTDLKPGRRMLVVRVFDKLGNQADLDPVPFQLVNPPPVAPIKLEVAGVLLLGSTTKPLPGIEVQLKQGETVVQKQATNGQGQFRFSDVEEGNYDLFANFRRRGSIYTMDAKGIKAEKAPAQAGTYRATD